MTDLTKLLKDLDAWPADEIMCRAAGAIRAASPSGQDGGLREALSSLVGLIDGPDLMRQPGFRSKIEAAMKVAPAALSPTAEQGDEG